MVGKSGNSFERVAPVVPIMRKRARRDLRRHGDRRREQQLNAPAEQVRHGEPHAAVRHVQHVDAGHLREQRAGKVRRRARAGRTIRQLALVLLAVVDQLGGVLRRHVRVRDQDVGRRGNERHRRKSRAISNGCSSLLTASDMMALVAAISSVWPSGAAAIDLARADQPAAAGAVLHDDGLAPQRRELLAHGAGQDVGAAAGRGRHHDADQRAGEGLREGGRGGGRGEG